MSPSERTLAIFAAFFLIAFLILLSGCTICPDQQCPVFPTSAPRQ